MTPELLEFRKWNVIAELIASFTENQLDPVVLNTDGIAMLIVHGSKAFFFSSYPEGSIAVETWHADTDEIISSDWLFPIPMRNDLTFREITHVAIAKVLA